LSNPEYIVNMNIKTNSNVEYIIMKFTYIISLIHNKTSDFFIYVLLSYFNKYHIEYKNNKLFLEIYKDQEKYFLNILLVLGCTPFKSFNKYTECIVRNIEEYLTFQK